MKNEPTKPSSKRPWLRYVVVAVGVILLIEIPFCVLALLSIVPYHGYWHSDNAGGTSILLYWDGTRVMTQHAQTPIWVIVLAAILLVLMIAWLAFWVYLTSRWLRRRRAS